MAYDGLSIDAHHALLGDRTITSRVTAYTAAQGVQPNLPVVDWSLTFDGKSETRAKGSVTFANPELWSANPFDVLSPWGTELTIERGIVLVDDYGRRRVEYIPMGRFLIVSAVDQVPTPQSGIQLEVEDRSRRLAEKKLDVTTASNPSRTVAAEIEALMRAVPSLATVEFVNESGALGQNMCPKMDYQRDRRAAVHKLAQAVGCEFFFDRLGRARLRRIRTLDDPVAWHIRRGETFLGATRKATREGAYSRVFVAQVLPQSTGSGTATAEPMTAQAMDGDPRSPTYYYGNFGDVTRKWASPLFTSQQQLQTAANGLLAEIRGFSYTLEVAHLPNEAMDPGDVCEIEPTADGTKVRQILDTFDVSGRPDSSGQSLGSRGYELPDEEGQAASSTTSDGSTAPPDATVVRIDWNEALHAGTVADTSETVSSAAWTRLLQLGYRGRPDDGRDALYIQRHVLDSIKAEVG